MPAILLFSSGVNLFIKTPQVLEGIARLGYPEDLARTIGVLEFVCALLYVIPRTAILGAV